MSDIAIKFENVSKQYRLGSMGTGTISHDLNRWWAMNIMGKEDPNLKVGQINDRSSKASGDYVWALKDIDYEVKQGDVLGIIGKNGAGKSTLLKILSRVTTPTTGRIVAKGRIASLLEVGTGFHPEMTGRENIYMNGSIMGMNKAEITRKLDEIIDFAGVEKYIDTPVKRYSSGMTVRLGFAIAAHLEPEILVVDEVLAVGDAEFQKKCLGKMNDISKGEGRTILFVSHNMGAVNDLCSSVLFLKNGSLYKKGNTSDMISEYFKTGISIDTNAYLNDYKSRRGNGEIRFEKISINNNSPELDPCKEIQIAFKIKAIVEVNKCVYFYLGIKDSVLNTSITSTGYVKILDNGLKKNESASFIISIPPNLLRTGIFPLYIWLGEDVKIRDYPFDIIDGVYALNLVSQLSSEDLGYNSVYPGGFFNLDFSMKSI